MARVFLAADVRHHRRVAIKVLRPEPAAALAEDPNAVCALLIEAMVESMRLDRPATPAFGRLEDVMSRGVHPQGPLANLLLARWHDARGDAAAGLRAARRRINNYNHHHTMMLPAQLREEGRLAAMTGDTAGAIRAYQHYSACATGPTRGPWQARCAT